MVFKGFRARLLLRLLVAIYVVYRTDWYITAGCLLLLAVFYLHDMLYFVERTNRDVSSFLESIKHSDFTQRFTVEGANSSFRDLYYGFNEISKTFQRAKTEKQAHYLYLQTIVEQVGIGILTFNAAGEVQLVNQVAKDLLRVPHLRNVQALERVSLELVQALWRTPHNEKALLTVALEQDQLQLNLHVTELPSQGQLLRIITLQNIRPELEEQELQTWQKVIQVLTHEIMNSVTPVISLTSTVAGLLKTEVIAKQAAGEAIEKEVLEDMQAGLLTIEKRSAGMLNFVKNYRRLMRLPASELRLVKVRELLQNVRLLLQPTMQTQHISLKLKAITE